MADQTKDLTVIELTEGMRQRVGEDSGLDATFKFAFNEGGVIFIDGKSVPNSVTNEDNPADVTLNMTVQTLNKLRRKEINAMMAVMAGQIRLEGNMMLAMKLDKVLG